MLIPSLIEHPQMIGPVLHSTPTWVWGLLAALLGLGLSLVRNSTASLLRVTVMPVAMTGLSLWGVSSAFGNSPMLGFVMLVWAAGALCTLLLIGSTAAPRGVEYDPASRIFSIPGSWVPLAMILGIFLTRYVVNVDIAMQPSLSHDNVYALVVGGIYGLFSGAFTGRAARLWRIAFHANGNGSGFTSLLGLRRDPW
jgi:hypothetical protein